MNNNMVKQMKHNEETETKLKNIISQQNQEMNRLRHEVQNEREHLANAL